MIWKCISRLVWILHCIPNLVLFFQSNKCPEQQSAPHTNAHLSTTLSLPKTHSHLCKSNTPTLSQNSSWYLVTEALRMYWYLCRFLSWLPNRGKRKPCVHSSGILWISGGLLQPWPPPLTHIHTHNSHAPCCPLSNLGPTPSVVVSHKATHTEILIHVWGQASLSKSGTTPSKSHRV